MEPHSIKRIVSQIGLVAVVFVAAAGLQAFAFSEPSGPPTTGDVAAPLNTSGDAQEKTGGLLLNTGGATDGLIVELGNVGIGTEAPIGTLDVENSTNDAKICLNGVCATSLSSIAAFNCPVGQFVDAFDSDGTPQCAPAVIPTPSATLTASPSSITAGNSSTLTWNNTNATSCTGTGFSTGGAKSGSVTVSPTVSTTYSVSCTNGESTASDSATVTVSRTFAISAPCDGGDYCAADSATANKVCQMYGFSRYTAWGIYPVTSSNPNGGPTYTGSEAQWTGSGWYPYWGGQCNTGGGCTPINWYEIDSLTCQ